MPHFHFLITVTSGPFIYSASPGDGYKSIDGHSDIELTILDDYSYVKQNSIHITVDGQPAFSGPNTFFAPWNGPTASIGYYTIDDYDGYKIVLGNNALMPPRTKKTVYVDAINTDGYHLNHNRVGVLPNLYSFRTGTELKRVYVGDIEIYMYLEFGEKMNYGITDPTSYIFDRGMYARSIDAISSSKVKMWVEKFYGNIPFNISTTSNILDQYGNPIPPSYNSIYISPFQSGADITNNKNLIRTWHESNIIQTDSQRIYLATTKGIDVFKRVGETVVKKWAQIFDDHKVNAMYIANFGGDLVIDEVLPPYLDSQNPASGGSAYPTSSIFFEIKDANTAPDLETVLVYVNGNLVFSGAYGGFVNNFAGDVTIGYKTLNFGLQNHELFAVDSVVTVRVISSDILGNRSDISYSFTINKIVLLSGFGIGAWGLSSFGSV